MGAMPMLGYMTARGLQVDLSHFERLGIGLAQDMDRITERVKDLTGVSCNLDSGDQVSALLFKTLGLKQARLKMTKSGDRESVEDEVLTQICHEHEVVPLIQEFKEYSKLKGTYVDPMPKLAKRTQFGQWRMFPHLGVGRVPSGRLNCKAPNLLAMPSRTDRGRQIRDGFITDPGWTFLSVDECLHPDTEVETLCGPKRMRDIRVGEKILAYKDRKITWGEVTVSRSMKPKRSYRITFDHGESVIASYDHRWPTQWSYTGKGRPEVVLRRTEELRVGERMVPFRWHQTMGYKTVYADMGSFGSVLFHHLVAEAYLGPRGVSYHVHHKDENKQNNAPENLEYKWNHKHASDHARSNYPKQDHAYRVEKLREGIRRRRRYHGTDNPNAKLSDSDHLELAALADSGATARQIATRFGLSYGYARRLLVRQTQTMNHRIVAIEEIGEQPLWGLTVEPDHTYVLSCGVVTHNSQIEVRVGAHNSLDENLIRIYENGEDIYSDFAIAAFSLADGRYKDPISGVWKYPAVDKMEHRYPSKTCVLAAIYDVSAGGLLEQMPVICANCRLPAAEHICGRFVSLWTEAKCQDILNAFYLRYTGLLSDRKRNHSRARQKGFIWDMWGRLLHVAAVRSVLQWVVSAALREVGNFPYQSGAQGTIKLTMAAFMQDLIDLKMLNPLNVFDAGSVIHPVLQIHDEILCECRDEHAEELGEHLKYRFETCCDLRVPIQAGACTAPTWGSLPK